MSVETEATGVAADEAGMSMPRRAALVAALALTFAGVGAGTWVLGSDGRDGESELAPARSLSEPVKARPPVVVAPPPKERASRSKGRTERTH
ncbi:MAG: hypothetical protein ACT4P1_00970 [Sporichthyaceae bacterium]